MVNTFLPYGNFKKVAKCLDSKRLGKQRVEAQQILNILEKQKINKNYNGGWINHPIVHLWRGHEVALKYYINVMIDEWIARGYVNNMKKHELPAKIKIPWFVRSKPINWSHQASLIRKYPEFYKKIFDPPSEYIKYKYIWTNVLNEEQLAALKKKNSPISLESYAILVDAKTRNTAQS